jgi:YHS domain-containing protein
MSKFQEEYKNLLDGNNNVTITIFQGEDMGRKMYKDVVCRAWLKKETKNKVEKDGKTYYFCSPACKEKFEKDTEKYLKLVG